MLVRSLQARQFRNLAPLELQPSPRFNVIAGDNGHGKTNLLEALYLLGTLRSFRTLHAGEIIGWGQGEARVAATVERAGLERVYEIDLEPRKRQVRLDGKALKQVGDYFGDFNVVLFAPEDLRVPRGSPVGRRKFLDRSVFNRQSSFLADAQRYARVLKSRNLLLRDREPNEQMLDVYDEQLADYGSRVVAARHRYVEELSPLFAEAFENITRTGLRATLQYEGEAPTREAYAAARRRDILRRQTSIGPHVDDLVFLLDEKPARAFASQGQLRALVLAYKTAEMRLLRSVHGDPPVLLLDDVSSELDPRRNELLFQFLAEIECQCFITTTHPSYVLVGENRVDYRMVAGVIQPRN